MLSYKEVFDFLKEAGTFYVATVDEKLPRLRPFGVVCDFEGKLYIATNNTKNVYKQILANPNVEICAMLGGKWIRLAGEAITDSRREAKKAMLDDNESMRGMYNEDDGIFEVLYLQNVSGTINSFTEPPVEFKF